MKEGADMKFIKSVFSKKEFISRIILDGKTFSQLRIDATDLYEIISDILLNTENMFYYCTQRHSCRTLKGTRKYVKKLMKSGILKSELDTILKSLNWDKDSLDISKTTFSGDLGEYLMNIVIETLNISETLISKVSLKTSPKMPSYGNDNIFYDYERNILYFGESKFYNNTITALTDAFNSITSHCKNLVELSFIKNHSSTFISENGRKLKKVIKRLERIEANKIMYNSITFIISDDNYEENDYINSLTKFVSGQAQKKAYINGSIIVFLPIISKQKFLSFFESKVNAL